MSEVKDERGEVFRIVAIFVTCVAGVSIMIALFLGRRLGDANRELSRSLQRCACCQDIEQQARAR